jgi:hypothetical protein
MGLLRPVGLLRPLEVGLLRSDCEYSSVKTLLVECDDWLFDCKRLLLWPCSVHYWGYWLSFLFHVFEILFVEDLLEQILLLTPFG